MINELIKLGYVEKEFFEGKVYYKLTDAFLLLSQMKQRIYWIQNFSKYKINLCHA